MWRNLQGFFSLSYTTLPCTQLVDWCDPQMRLSFCFCEGLEYFMKENIWNEYQHHGDGGNIDLIALIFDLYHNVTVFYAVRYKPCSHSSSTSFQVNTRLHIMFRRNSTVEHLYLRAWYVAVNNEGYKTDGRCVPAPLLQSAAHAQMLTKHFGTHPRSSNIFNELT